MSDTFQPSATSMPQTSSDFTPEFPSWTKVSSPADDSVAPVNPDLPKGFKWMDGRGFNVEGNPVFLLPSDSREITRLTAQHYQMRYVFQGNYQAPIAADLERGIKVLDAGCGSGIWTTEMATTYPASSFFGTDIANVFAFPDAPANCTFQVANTLKGLPFPDNTFDFVFQRFHELCYRKNEWPLVLKELKRVTKPGGWIELMETSLKPQDAGPCLSQLFEYLQMVLEMRDVYLDFCLNMVDSLRSLGLRDTQQDHRSSPTGWGPGDLERISRENLLAMLASLRPQMLVVLGIAGDEFDALVEGAEQELGEHKTFIDVLFAYGRKPVENEREGNEGAEES